MKSLEIAGEKIEQATKGNALKPIEKPVEKPQAQETTEKPEIQTPKKEEKTEEKTIETKNSTMQQNAETAEPEKPNEGNVEVTVKIKTPKKKEKSRIKLVDRAGFEPAIFRLSVERSSRAELPVHALGDTSLILCWFIRITDNVSDLNHIIFQMPPINRLGRL